MDEESNTSSKPPSLLERIPTADVPQTTANESLRATSTFSRMNRSPTQQDYEDLAREGNVTEAQDKEVESLDELKFLVTFDMDDPDRPLNWPMNKKLYHTAFYGITTFTAQFGSSMLSPVIPHLTHDFGISEEVAILPTSLYVLGIAFGPMCFAPISEMYGRKIGVFVPLFISIMLNIGTASSRDVAALMCTRFFAGFFAGAPVVSSGGVLADIWHPTVRGTSLVFYAFFVICGAVYGPIFSSLITRFNVGDWRWAVWLLVITQFVVLIVNVTVLSESYAPVILKRKARDLRLKTRNWAYHAKHDEWQLDFHEFLGVHCLRPFAMMATPIVFVVAMFASYVFGLLYITITGIGYIFQITYGWGYVSSNLPLIALFLGCVTGGVVNIICGKRYRRLSMANGGKPLPEERFVPLLFCAWMMPAGLFIFAWTARPDIHWIAPCFGIGIMGCGFFVIFQGCLNYLVDAFTKYAASAIAANTFLRSVLGAVFPLFGKIMFKNLGVHWGGSLIAFIALGMIPIPYIFYIFGKQIRAKNPYARLVT